MSSVAIGLSARTRQVLVGSILPTIAGLIGVFLSNLGGALAPGPLRERVVQAGSPHDLILIHVCAIGEILAESSFEALKVDLSFFRDFFTFFEDEGTYAKKSLSEEMVMHRESKLTS